METVKLDDLVEELLFSLVKIVSQSVVPCLIRKLYENAKYKKITIIFSFKIMNEKKFFCHFK